MGDNTAFVNLEHDIDDLLVTNERNTQACLYASYARNLHTEKKYLLAEEYYRKHLEINPENIKVILRLADLYTEQGLYNQAMLELQSSAIINPKCSEVHVKIAELYERSSNAIAAIKHLQQHQGDYPNPQITFHLAGTYFRNGQYRRAAEEASAFLRSNPNSKKGALLLVNAYTEVYGLTREGLSSETYAIILDRDYSALFFKSLLDNNRLAELLLFRENGYQRHIDSDLDFYSKLENYLKKCTVSEKLCCIDCLLNKEMLSWKTYYGIGRQLLLMGYHRESARVLEYGHLINQKSTLLLRDYCEALYLTSQYAQVAEVVLRHFSKYGESEHFYLILAKAYVKLHDRSKAEHYLHKGIKSKPYHKSVLSYAALFYYKDNDINMAEYYAMESLRYDTLYNKRASWVIEQIETARIAIRPDNAELVATSHMGEHFKNILDKPIHGVFKIDQNALANVLKRLDQHKYQRLGESYTYRIPYPDVGYEGGKFGDGHTLHNLVIVTRLNNRNVITAYPVD